MHEVDVESKVRGGTEDDQKKHGTFRENFHRLRTQFRELMVAGAANPETFESMFFTLLHGFENERLKSEHKIKEYEKKIEWLRAEQHAAAQYAAMLEAIVTVQVDRAKQGLEPDEPRSPDTPKTDKEVLATICMCGCQDAEDASNCDCQCHIQGFCGDERCAVCPGIKAAKELEEKPIKRSRIRKKSPAKKPKKAAK